MKPKPIFYDVSEILGSKRPMYINLYTLSHFGYYEGYREFKDHRRTDWRVRMLTKRIAKERNPFVKMFLKLDRWWALPGSIEKAFPSCWVQPKVISVDSSGKEVVLKKCKSNSKAKMHFRDLMLLLEIFSFEKLR